MAGPPPVREPTDDRSAGGRLPPTPGRAVGLTAGLEVRRPATPLDLVDTVGAGDSFTSGLRDGLKRADLVGGSRRQGWAAIDESSPVSVLDAASLIAAITCSRPGADLPTRAGVEAARSASDAVSS